MRTETNDTDSISETRKPDRKMVHFKDYRNYDTSSDVIVSEAVVKRGTVKLAVPPLGKENLHCLQGDTMNGP